MAVRKIVADIYGNSLIEARYQQIESELRKFAVEKLDFAFSPKGTQLFSLMELRQSYARRSIDLVDSIYNLLEANKVVPAAVLGRSLIETVAMGTLFLKEMLDCVQMANRARLESRLTRFYAGMVGQVPKPIHVMDAIRQLHAVDADYVAYLDQKHGLFTEIDRLRTDLANGTPVERHAELLSITQVYDRLSEVAHPNGMGVQYLYPDPINEDEQVDRIRDQYKRLAVSSAWQCKHLLRWLEETRDLPQQYRNKIGVPQEGSL
jgi:hypothetical protein